MTEYDYSAADIVKNARARLHVAAGKMAEWAQHFPDETVPVAEAAELFISYIGDITADLEEHLAAIGGEVLVYDDGSPVASRIALSEDRGFSVIWDPRPGHKSNRPHLAAENVELPDGTIVDLVVSGWRTLDVVRKCPAGG